MKLKTVKSKVLVADNGRTYPLIDPPKFGRKTVKIKPEAFQLISSTFTNVTIASVEYHYPFYARIKTTKTKIKQFYPLIYGMNHEIVFTGEPHKNKNDVIKLLKMWFPQILIK